ncbi:hypothetical protein [Blastococcus sp. TF02A-26]|uniref:hypothetical protein n=1 Tax=Blastococcus sp. TF02A-26 TaxID=2250577 RepID=UPI000DEAC1F2|nr:hypothetical protein [Blastococcus sp. TF02A-26]RBY85283.1 hypothetical protein DQ240_11870 [Blastococcus sp. TF02A-26]
MRASHLATALTAFAAGLTAATVLHRRAERPGSTDVATAPAERELPATPEPAGVVLPFLRAVPVPAAGPVRCGDNGGLTKAGAPCAARATSGGRCHHHRIAA